MIPPYEETTKGLDGLRRQLAASRGRAAGKPMTDQEIIDAEFLSERVAIGVTQALQLIMTDDELIESFWKRGYTSLASQSSTRATMWAGRSFFYALVFSVTLWGLTWIVNHNDGSRIINNHYGSPIVDHNHDNLG